MTSRTRVRSLRTACRGLRTPRPRLGRRWSRWSRSPAPPVDSHSVSGMGHVVLWLGLDLEGREPFAVGLAVDPDAGRCGRKPSRPHHWYYCPFGEFRPERAVRFHQPESADSVVQCWLRMMTALIVGQSPYGRVSCSCGRGALSCGWR